MIDCVFLECVQFKWILLIILAAVIYGLHIPDLVGHFRYQLMEIAERCINIDNMRPISFLNISTSQSRLNLCRFEMRSLNSLVSMSEGDIYEQRHRCRQQFIDLNTIPRGRLRELLIRGGKLFKLLQ
jgi:hypothetical protein